ncbi:Cof-type HAD-IIB family hydrolase [Lentilactobacillus buchneri]|uniref:HAD superfamily hydrolase n=2 Tax=Lentilactobacillus buchneri TaxID=1581 RepID=J9W252_LENBU|nr:Cof-type HAD-IIB family hydrolase [Lentilactobacillus buchneri]MCC6100118.1 Cof-type HAD-IIB family hydrolase [Lactobacillus sp.]WCJ51915.1 Cof-type HAD-IIB family hydrolase [Lentilactobacillus sp. Egmn17]AEB73514.1 Cof-like hydrolase [Lentilactobacillus buchneri NRRL B-30929]AFS00419.1 HAD superfamily hydrolase [Lentilactobacillus buchneri subsp. silagei CD034]KRK69011.1 cof family hydrolase [Lentilactobacillus buchneri DSM 20057]
MYKAVVFFDLDGTLFDNEKNVSDENVAAINELRANNILPVISTGRNIFEIQYVIDATGINSLVSANGSYVQYEGKKLKAEQISDDVIEEILAFAKQQGDVISFYNNKEFALTFENDMTKVNYRLLRLTPHVDPEFYKHHEVNFLNVFNYDKDKLYQDKFKGKLSLVRNNPRCLDTMKWGVSKQTGIQALMKKLNLGDVPSYAFGDQMNDLQMFSEVKFPIAMGNGVPEVKEKASFVTKSNINGGIVNGLKHYGLID